MIGRMTTMHRTRLGMQALLVGAWLLLSMISPQASAQARAWLDRDSIAAGETVTLNIETTSAVSSAPDYSPLQRDFFLAGHSSRREFELVNGQSRTRTLYAVALQPKRDGLIAIPSLVVGGERTQPLNLQVAAGGARAPARAGEDVFIESEPDDPAPYVQQAVGWVVRLYSAAPLVSGQLDQTAPEGASLQRVGDDAQYVRELAGRRYSVVERRFLLVPERSGTLTVPGATFEGRGTGGFFDDLFGGRGGELRANAAPRFLQVRPAPAGAPQPWLPLHDLQLRYQSTPQDLRAGSAATLTIEAVADGATAAQMPELQLPAIDGVQVFPDPVQADERFVDGRPRVKLTRRFSLVPSRAGTARLSGMRLAWWDVGAGAVRTASLPALSWPVAAGDAMANIGGGAVAPVASIPAPGTATGTATQAMQGADRNWILAALLFAALWLFTLVWGLHRGAPTTGTQPPAGAPETGPVAVRTPAELKRALDHADFGELGGMLCAMARPPAHGIDELLSRLDDPRQRQAIDAMERARWGGGDGAAARTLLRSAFAQGPRWRTAVSAPPSPLPPLYPPGRSGGRAEG
jgi:hypothetical protein